MIPFLMFLGFLSPSSKKGQTVDKTALRPVGGGTHKKDFLKSFLRILKVLFLKKHLKWGMGQSPMSFVDNLTFLQRRI